MMKRSIAIVMLAVMLLGILVGCDKNKAITAEEAQQIVIAHTGADSKAVSDIHVHIQENDAGEVCYSVQVTVNRKTYTYLVHGTTGEILSVTEGGHSH